MGIRKDCFGWTGERCNVLTGEEPPCKYETHVKCRFYMSREEYEAKLKETEEKLKKR